MAGHQSRRYFLAAVGMTAIGGCVGGDDGVASDAATPDLPLRDATPPLEYTLAELFDESVVSDRDPDDPPDVGNFDAAIDEPSFLSAESAPLAEHDFVFGVERNGAAKAYPQYILVWHEVVNDVVGGDAICITYCPLTGSVIGFERGETSLGMSNKLVNSNLILYDRATETWWPQILGVGIANEHQGRALVEIEVTWTSWSRWRDEHPDTKVLSEETDYIRDYDEDPYGSYDPEPGGYYATETPGREVMHEDDRFHPKEVVVGARTSDGVIAFVKETLRQQKIATESVNGTGYSAFYDRRFDSAYVYRNPDQRTFSYQSGQYADSAGEMFRADQLPLENVNAFDAMWFAWFAYFPNTAVSAPEATFFGT